MKRLVFLFLVLLLLTEVVARFFLGLGEVPVYIEDAQYEYIYAPDQNVKRFGNRILTNSFSMRSEEIDSTAVRILGFGDSVINGGSQTDQDSLATTLVSQQLSDDLNQKVQLLNVSANSWGPDNSFAYLEKHGDFGSRAIVLFVSSHDLYDLRHFQKVVGVNPAWPAEQPFCAITDGLFKYLIPTIRSKVDPDYDPYSYLGISTSEEKINPGFDSLITYCKSKGLPLIVYLHPTLQESKSGTYDSKGQKIIQLFDSSGINIITPIKDFKDPSLYRDNIHLTSKGQKKMAEVLMPELSKLIETEIQ